MHHRHVHEGGRTVRAKKSGEGRSAHQATGVRVVAGRPDAGGEESMSLDHDPGAGRAAPGDDGDPIIRLPDRVHHRHPTEFDVESGPRGGGLETLERFGGRGTDRRPDRIEQVEGELAAEHLHEAVGGDRERPVVCSRMGGRGVVGEGDHEELRKGGAGSENAAECPVVRESYDLRVRKCESGVGNAPHSEVDPPQGMEIEVAANLRLVDHESRHATSRSDRVTPLNSADRRYSRTSD